MPSDWPRERAAEAGRSARRRYVELERSGHWPMLEAPNDFHRELVEFIESTEPWEYDEEQVRERLLRGPR